ncbi:MAG: hypothetical protein WCZ20_13825 [Hydrogenophaga sp.]|nr:hypothetical protein [Gammaproteobacteria bacterium]
MPIPDFQALMRPFLVALADDKPHALPDVHGVLCSEFQLPPEEVAKRISSDWRKDVYEVKQLDNDHFSDDG